MPGELRRIERCAQALMGQFEATPHAAFGRNRSQTARIAKALANQDGIGEHGAALLAALRAAPLHA